MEMIRGGQESERKEEGEKCRMDGRINRGGY